MNKNTLNNVNFKQFEDEFGNSIKEFEVVQYYKNSNGEWIEAERFESSRTYYVIDGQLYYKCSDNLIPMNMDFNSEDCGACYQVVEEIKDTKKITNNEILFTYRGINNLSLHKQSYSDGTCFYSLQDSRGNFRLGYGSDNIHDIINQLDMEIESSKILQQENESMECTEIYQESIALRQNIINELKKVNNEICRTYFKFNSKIRNGWKVIEQNNVYDVYTYTSCKKLGNWQLFSTFDDKEKMLKYFENQINNTSENLEDQWCKLEHEWFINTYEILNRKVA